VKRQCFSNAKITAKLFFDDEYLCPGNKKATGEITSGLQFVIVAFANLSA
jgi:hypothetical protein